MVFLHETEILKGVALETNFKLFNDIWIDIEVPYVSLGWVLDSYKVKIIYIRTKKKIGAKNDKSQGCRKLYLL